MLDMRVHVGIMIAVTSGRLKVEGYTHEFDVNMGGFNDYSIILKKYSNTGEHSTCIYSFGLIFKF